MWKNLLWDFGSRHAALIKRLPFIRDLAEWLYTLLVRVRTREVYTPQYLQSFRKSVRGVPMPPLLGSPGFNISGFIETENGVGEAVRANIRAIQALSVPFALNNLETPVRHQDRTFGAFSSNNPYPINIVHVNADQLPRFIMEKGVAYFRGKYNIGVWVWELPELPEHWRFLRQYFDELWTPSTFCSRAVALHSEVPVITIPSAIAVDQVRPVDRSYFGLQPGTFIFLFIFDMLSYFERKNPLAVIEAFRSAFSADDNAGLVLKIVNAHSNPPAAAQLAAAVRGLPVTVIDSYLAKDEVHALMSLSDCYVSLHRSEGFGLTLAECMYLKKPVIATAYSGNMDFMTDQNSFPVRYDLVPIREDCGPYQKGGVWAEPDSAHAAELMRFTYEHREQALAKGELAAQDIRTKLSPEAVGSLIAARMRAMRG